MTPSPHRTDATLREAIDQELAWRPAVQAEHLGVAVTAGAVTVSGHVRSYAEKLDVVHAVMHVRGVTAVADELSVHHASGVPDDTDTARAADQALARTAVLNEGSVCAVVRDRVITLSGAVDWQYQRQAAARAVEGLAGMTAVQNRIVVTPETTLSPTSATAGIVAALARHAQAAAGDIHVAVNGNDIILTGTTSSLVERSYAENAAWCTPGAATVENLLTVSP